MQFLVDFLQVETDRAGRHLQLGGGRLVIVAVNDQLLDLAELIRNDVLVREDPQASSRALSLF